MRREGPEGFPVPEPRSPSVALASLQLINNNKIEILINKMFGVLHGNSAPGSSDEGVIMCYNWIEL